LVERRGKSMLDNSHMRLFLVVLVFGVVLLSPLVASFNSILNWIVIRTGLYTLLRDWILPIQVRMVAVLLGILGFQVTDVNYRVLILERGTQAYPILFLWNCVGWQTFLLLLVTLIIGLRGRYSATRKAICVALGLEVAVLISTFRILVAALIAFYWGFIPAIIFHDYMGTVFVLTWIFLYWYISFKYILLHPEGLK